MSANTWALVGANTLGDINPRNNPAINPLYPAGTGWGGSQAGMILAWNGAAWDEASATLWFPLQGGHADYGGNEPYKIGLGAESPTFIMVRNPSGAIGNVLNTDDGNENSGVYSDGRLRSPHSYNNNIYVPGVGPVITRLAGVYKSGQTGTNKAYKLDEITGEATLICDFSALNSGTQYGGAAYDAVRNRILTTGIGNTPLVKIDMTTGIGSIVVASDNYITGGAHLKVMQDDDLLMVLHQGGSGYPPAVYIRELSSLNTKIHPTITGAYSAGLSLTGHAGLEWDSVNRRFLIWDNATNTTEISTLTPGANPRTDPWVAGVLAVSGSNAVTPTAAAPNGTYGRFGYSKKLGGCFLLNSTSQKMYFFATE